MKNYIFPRSFLEKYEIKEALESKDSDAYKVMHKLMKKQMFVYIIDSSDSDAFVSRLQDKDIIVFDKYSDDSCQLIIVNQPIDQLENYVLNQLHETKSTVDPSKRTLFSVRNSLILLFCILLIFGLIYLLYINNVFGYRISEEEEVDLGLSVLWSSRNLGASSIEDDGDFYAWGETEPKNEYSELSYKYSSDNEYSVIGEDISGTQLDAATLKLKNGWRMPTKIELDELVSKCKWEEVYHNGKTGYVVTGPNKKSIFIPCSGHMDGTFHNGNTYYWSSTFHNEPERGRRCNAWNLAVDIYLDGYPDYTGTNHIFQRRYIGRAIRPVKNKQKNYVLTNK